MNSCQSCKSSKSVVPIIYGDRGQSAVMAAKKGKCHLGPCIRLPNAPQFYCKTCKIEF
ncbi:hypothetical protein HY990_05630 [Candidatus Micrarchaeota archaeon]|nr:hypothetical protein [Candidatus Micrarchaeota archaeon]